MQDKFAGTALDRFEIHQRNIKREVEYLEYFDYDYLKDLSPDFREQLSVIKTALGKMQEAVEQLGKTR